MIGKVDPAVIGRQLAVDEVARRSGVAVSIHAGPRHEWPLSGDSYACFGSPAVFLPSHSNGRSRAYSRRKSPSTGLFRRGERLK
jgi:hypothetical protein